MEKKSVRPAPAGINDWWNKVKGTTPPSVRRREGSEPRAFTAREHEEAMKDLYENGFQ